MLTVHLGFVIHLCLPHYSKYEAQSVDLLVDCGVNVRKWIEIHIKLVF